MSYLGVVSILYHSWSFLVFFVLTQCEFLLLLWYFELLFDGVLVHFCSAGNLFLWFVCIVFKVMSCIRHDFACSVYGVNLVGIYLPHNHDLTEAVDV